MDFPDILFISGAWLQKYFFLSMVKDEIRLLVCRLADVALFSTLSGNFTATCAWQWLFKFLQSSLTESVWKATTESHPSCGIHDNAPQEF